MPPRYLSGVQPTGKLHLGNYFGAVKQHIALQSQGEALYFIANYHACTTIKNPKELAALTFDVAADYLALGLDPAQCAFFRQSDVPEVTELTWFLACVTGKGLLERAHSYKDKVAKGIEASMGLFCYPILMAADIIIYKSNFVPVGQDQVQHIEMARDMAGYFNQTYGKTFPLPEPLLNQTAKVPGLDGEKMSKSYNNTIEIFETGNALRKKVMRIVTDSLRPEEPKDPAQCNVFALLSLFLDEAEKAEWAERYRTGPLSYAEAKTALYERIEAFFADARARRTELVTHPEQVEAVLIEGAGKARAIARRTMDEVRRKTGIAL